MADPFTTGATAGVSDGIGNDDVNWDAFDSADYFDHNYGTLRPDDKRIIGIVADFFQEQQQRFPGSWVHRAIDVGPGANLYPALTMLPFAAEISLLEKAASNRDWLRNQQANPNDSWNDFWCEMTPGRQDYQAINDPLNLLAIRAQVVKGSIFTLPADSYDMGTMFFVAESITNRDDEFERAVRAFVGSLRNHAPFAAAFMKDSSGYSVRGVRFPACSVDEKDISRLLSKVARDVTITFVDSNDLRDGYSGMIVATGRKKV